MTTLSQMKTKLMNVLDSKLSIGEQSLTEEQKKKTLSNLGIWDKLVDYGNKIESILESIVGIEQNIDASMACKLNLSGGTMTGALCLDDGVNPSHSKLILRSNPTWGGA